MLFRIVLGLLFAGGALAQDYPSRPVKIIVPYAPGGSTDIIGRIVAHRLSESLGQSFLVDNRPGASGNLALEAVAKAPPDGYTLLVGNVSTNAINENTFAQQLSIRPSRDLVGVAKLIEIPHVVVAAPGFPPNSIAELIAEARRNPGGINYASGGQGAGRGGCPPPPPPGGGGGPPPPPPAPPQTPARGGGGRPPPRPP